MKCNIRENFPLKLNISKKNLIIGFIVGIVLLVSFSGVAMAKYYAERDNKGISVASGLYFNSNCISNVAGDTYSDNHQELASIDLSTVPGYVNPEGGSNFYLDICNYDNHLLYNELYLDVEYTICFLKLVGKSASVEYKDDKGNSIIQPLTDGQVFTLSNKKIEGGAARFDTYIIRTENEDDGTDAKVLVMAYPTAPEYVASATEKMRLIGTLQAQPKNVEVGIDSNGFEVLNNLSDGDDWHSAVEKMSGLVYTIKTNGDDVTSGVVKGELKVTWNYEMLDINQYDTHYLEAVKNGTIITDITNKTKTMSVKVLPYANVKVTFYKTNAFLTAFNSTMTRESLEGLVSVQLAESE